ncbi:MAG: peptidyl-prolyl cis-trans isomerase [Candidatus Omnitrophica bacterium]|nr:peptidyl-prolyl cis-trans isomerase [Candidatus Omnitrophota bacterium]
MKRLKLFSFVMLILSVPSVAMARPLNDAIVAIVNSDVITLKDLKDYVAGVYRQLKVEHRSPEEIQQIMTMYQDKGVNQLVEDKLIQAAADTKGIEIRPEVVNKRLKEITDRYPSEEDFLKEIGSQGITVTDIRTKMINQFKAKYIVELEVKDKVFVNPEDVTRYFSDHKDEFETKTKYNLDSIFISSDKGKDAALMKIKEARAKIVLGASFDQVSKEYSQTPSVGIVEQGQMVPAVEREVFALKTGDLSQPVEVDNGVYIFKVKNITLGSKQSLSEVKDAIYAKLFDQQFQDKFKAWLEKLRSKAYVEIRN